MVTQVVGLLGDVSKIKNKIKGTKSEHDDLDTQLSTNCYTECGKYMITARLTTVAHGEVPTDLLSEVTGKLND